MACCAVSCYAVQLDREAEDLLWGLLTWDPQQRLGSKGVHQIQRHPFFATIPWGSLEAQVERDQQEHEQQRMHELQQAAAAGNGSNGSSTVGGQYSLMSVREAAASRAGSPASAR